MFRDMLRFKQQMTDEECLEILRTAPRGVLSVLGDDGYPYGMPLNHFYCEEDGKIYFHGGRMGHKIDALRKDPKASFCVMDEGVRNEGEWFLRFQSVIVFGRIEIVEDRETVAEMSRRLSRQFTDDEAYIQNEIERYLNNTLLFALTPEHITGKRIKEE